MSLRRFIALSDHWFARFGRGVFRTVQEFSVPAPRVIARPVLALFLLIRWIYYFVARVFVCEPLFKAYCSRYGHKVRTGAYVPFVVGKGNLIVGDDVVINGKSNFYFASRCFENPTLIIGNHCFIGHGCEFTIGKRISIGSHCRIAGGVRMFDASGHPTDPVARRDGLPTPLDMVRPIVIADDVWIGGHATICPGVNIGEGSVVGTGSVVTKDVPPHTVVAGNPARPVRNLVATP